MAKKNIFLITCFIATLVLFIVIGAFGTKRIRVPLEYFTEFVSIIPGPIYTDMIVLFGLPFVFVLLYYIAAPAMTRFLVWLHKLINRGASYGIAKLGAEIHGTTLFKRVWLASILAFSMASLAVQSGGWRLFRFVPPEMISSDYLDFVHEMEGLFLGTFFMTPFAFLIFLPIWCIEDCGIIMYKNYSNQRITPDIEGVQGLYENIVKGYAGISTVITLATYIYKGFTTISITAGEFLTPVILVILPFLAIGLISLPIGLYEQKNRALAAKVHQKLENAGLKHVVIPEMNALSYIDVRDEAKPKD